MNSGGSSGAPQFNAGAVAQQQYQTNANTGISNAYLQNTNQVTPYGNLTYNQTGSTNVGGVNVPSFTATESLTPQGQSNVTGTQALQGGALGAANTALGGVNDALNNQGGYTNQAYSDLMSRQNQQFNTQTDQLKTQLANQGIAPGTTAYNNAFIPINQSNVDATNQAQVQAAGLGAQNVQNSISPLASLYGIGSGTALPSSTYAPATSATIPQTDVTSPYVAQYQGQLNSYNQGLQAQNSMLGGLFGLGGSAAGGLLQNPGLFL